MNVETNELMRLTDEEIKRLKEQFNTNLVRVPEDLEEEANRVLEDKEKVIVNKKISPSLAKWAKRVRDNQKKNKR